MKINFNRTIDTTCIPFISDDEEVDEEKTFAEPYDEDFANSLKSSDSFQEIVDNTVQVNKKLKIIKRKGSTIILMP